MVAVWVDVERLMADADESVVGTPPDDDGVVVVAAAAAAAAVAC